MLRFVTSKARLALSVFILTFCLLPTLALAAPTMMSHSGDYQIAPPNTAFAAPLEVTLIDANVTRYPNITVDWTITSGSGSLSSASSVTDSLGRAQVIVTAGSTSGPLIVTARSGTVIANFQLTVTVSPTLTIVSGDGQRVEINTIFPLPLVVHVTNEFHSTVGNSVTWAVTSGNVILSSSSSPVDVNGNAQVTLTAGGLPNFFAAVTATYSDPTVPTVATTFHEEVSPTTVPRLAEVSGAGQSALASTPFAQPLVVQATNRSVPAAGTVIAWSVSGGGTLSSDTSIADSQGLAQIYVTAGAASGPLVVAASWPAGGGQDLFFHLNVIDPTQTALSIVSGDGQNLPPDTTSALLIVLLKDLSGNPVSGASVNWSATNGTTASTTSVTDSNGRASNTVSITLPGAASVQASASLSAAGAVTFTLNSGLAYLPALTQKQQAVAAAIDVSCAALASSISVNQSQQDLLERCHELAGSISLDSSATINALDNIFPDVALAQGYASLDAASSQFQNLKVRIAALRSHTRGLSFSGLAVNAPGGSVSANSLAQAVTGEREPESGRDFGPWAFFVAGNIGRGRADPGSVNPKYDFHLAGLTGGVDYRLSDRLIFGGALGFTQQDTALAADRGKLDSSSYALSVYSTYYQSESWYGDGVLTWGRSRFDLHRRIRYSLPLAGGGSSTIDTVANSKPDGDLLQGAFTAGRDWQKGAWGFGPYARLLYTRLSFGRIRERIGAGPGNGLALTIDARDLTSFSSQLGGKVTYRHETGWGVLIPHVQLEWQREYKDDAQALTARLLADPTQTPISVTGDRRDNNFFRLGLGVTMAFTGSKSGFATYERTFSREGWSQDNLALGLRMGF